MEGRAGESGLGSSAARGSAVSVAPDVERGLVEALRRDGPEGAEQLVERYGDRVYRVALGITGVKEDAEEAAEDALRTVVRTIHTFTGESAFGTWIDRTAAHAAYQKLRT